ncbi:HlyD family type I secretion periplasmic adaptor subunit [Novosphingobium sp.]|uniref:HlyD family type I secretion periplasmic adaptor subunit n=1 Tax=Novosphingobium sp. TaxID=1874826 RepID=UPI0025ED638C|nr:HlyD family type I secretion periplasmic adaptor subunit [Novosphingobium sp.]
MANMLEYLKGDEADLDEQEFKARRSANVLLYIIGGFFVVFLLWATFTKLDRTVHSMGRVVPSSKMQVVSNLEGGVIEEILVKPGQVVKRGDILVRLSPTLSGAQFGSSSASVAALRAKIARLNAEVRGTSPDYGATGSSQVAVERSLHSARSAELQGMLAAGQARAAQAERSVNEAEAMVAARRSNLDAAENELRMIEPLAAKEIVSRVDLIKAQNAVAVARNDVIAAEAAVSRARSAVAEARSATAQARSDWMGRAGLELSQAQAELSAQQQTLPALSDKVDRTTIRAPMSGRINRVLVSTVGGTVTPGSPIAEVVPTGDSLFIEAMVRPSDIANVRIAQKATVEITAYNSAIFGKLDGRVVSISPDALVNEKTGESFYTVEIETPGPMMDGDGNKLPIGPGMVANVSLLGEKRSVLSYIFTPITRLAENAFRE